MSFPGKPFSSYPRNLTIRVKLSNAQLNIGAVGKDKKVDQWHFDSANFVAVLIFSNIDNMIGRDSI